MKITSVQPLLFSTQNPEGYQCASVLVEVRTNKHILGYGETLMGLFDAETAASLIRYYEPILVGKDPLKISELWQMMFDSSIWWGRNGAVPSVIGAIESALWDILGKIEKKSCAELWSDLPQKEIPVYASLGAAYYEEDAFKKQINELLHCGHQALKLGLSFLKKDGSYTNPKKAENTNDLDQTLEYIRNIAGNDFIIGVDGHMGGIPDPINCEQALQICKVLEKHKVNFFEEPLSYLDPSGYAWLRKRTTIPIAGGESFSLWEGFKHFTDKGSLDFLQPDVNFVGGPSQLSRIIHEAKKLNLKVMPHNWCGGPGIMTNLQSTLARPEVSRLEWPTYLTELQKATIKEMPILKDGYLIPQNVIGMGIEINSLITNQFPYRKGMAERASGLFESNH